MPRILALVVAGALVALAVAPSAPALAQDAPVVAAQAAGAAADAEAAVGASPEGTSRGQALLFWLFAALTVVGSIVTITRRNLVAAVMFLVGTFLALSALYAMLLAHFLAVIQVLVYAGAIMVLFVFVIMILNKEEQEPWALRGLFGKLLAGGALAYFTVRLVAVLWGASERLPAPATLPASYGTTRSLGDVLFSTYLFPFEAISLVLLIAVVGALVIAHPSHVTAAEDQEEAGVAATRIEDTARTSSAPPAGPAADQAHDERRTTAGNHR